MITRTAKQNSALFVSLRIKLLVGFTVLFSGVFAGAYYWFYTFTVANTTEYLQEDLVNKLKGAIAGIDGDEFAVLAKVQSGQDISSNNPLYMSHQAWLNQVHAIDPRSNPYTFIEGNKPYEVLWIGDIFRTIRPNEATTFRQSYRADPTHTKLYRGLTELTVNMMPYIDQWGTWVSAYSPIRNSAGQVVGGMGIDLDASYIINTQKHVLERVLNAFMITYGTLFILVFLISGALTRHLQKLAESAEQIGAGNYETRLSLPRNRWFIDEMDTLAHVFESMMNNIRARERLLKAVVEDQTELICRFLPNGTLTFTNQAYSYVFSHWSDQVIDSNGLFFIPDMEQSTPEQYFACLSWANPVVTYEHHLRLPNGILRWQQWTVRAIFDDQNALLEFQAVGRDITEQKWAEEALRESEAKHRALVEQIPAVTYISVLENPGHVLYISPQVETLLGFSQSEWLDNPDLWAQQLHPGDRDRILHRVTTRTFEAQPLVEDYRLMTRSGTIRWIRDNAVVLTDDAGHPLFLQGVLFDVSDRKQAEEELQRLNAELEIRVQERTGELTLANKQLQTSLDEKELLLKEVHHRVKNNLQIISSIFSLQSQCIKNKDSDVLAALTESQNRIRSMSLIHEKLYQSPSLSKIDFADYVQSLATSLFSSYNTSTNLISLHLHVARVTLTIDTAIPCGLLLNELVSNSLKHAFPERRSGEINIYLEMNAENQLSLIVHDNGVGLPADLELTRANSLGLRLIRALTRQLDGTLDVDSTMGTAFKITFPLPPQVN